MAEITKAELDHLLTRSLNIGEGIEEGSYQRANEEFNHQCGIAYEQGDLVHKDELESLRESIRQKDVALAHLSEAASHSPRTV